MKSKENSIPLPLDHLLQKHIRYMSDRERWSIGGEKTDGVFRKMRVSEEESKRQ